MLENKNCPCPVDCIRHGKCKECIEFHHSRNQQTYCEVKQSKGTKDGIPSSGIEIRLLDYANCAG